MKSIKSWEPSRCVWQTYLPIHLAGIPDNNFDDSCSTKMTFLAGDLFCDLKLWSSCPEPSTQSANVGPLVQKAERKLLFPSVVCRSFSTCADIFDLLYNVRLPWAQGYSHGKCRLLQIPGALAYLTFPCSGSVPCWGWKAVAVAGKQVAKNPPRMAGRRQCNRGEGVSRG